jgi:hypothetical protein
MLAAKLDSDPLLTRLGLIEAALTALQTTPECQRFEIRRNVSTYLC